MAGGGSKVSPDELEQRREDAFKRISELQIAQPWREYCHKQLVNMPSWFNRSSSAQPLRELPGKIALLIEYCARANKDEPCKFSREIMVDLIVIHAMHTPAEREDGSLPSCFTKPKTVVSEEGKALWKKITSAFCALVIRTTYNEWTLHLRTEGEYDDSSDVRPLSDKEIRAAAREAAQKRAQEKRNRAAKRQEAIASREQATPRKPKKKAKVAAAEPSPTPPPKKKRRERKADAAQPTPTPRTNDRKGVRGVQSSPFLSPTHELTVLPIPWHGKDKVAVQSRCQECANPGRR